MYVLKFLIGSKQMLRKMASVFEFPNFDQPRIRKEDGWWMDGSWWQKWIKNSFPTQQKTNLKRFCLSYTQKKILKTCLRKVVHSIILVFLNGPNPASFCFFKYLFIFILFTWQNSTNLTINDKSVYDVLGIQSQGGSMVSVDEFTELWRHPTIILVFKSYINYIKRYKSLYQLVFINK